MSIPITFTNEDGSTRVQYHVDARGLLQGSFIQYKNGQILTHTEYVDGVIQSRIVYENDCKTLIEHSTYKNGELTKREGRGLYNYEECTGCGTRLLVDLKGKCYVKDCAINPKT